MTVRRPLPLLLLLQLGFLYTTWILRWESRRILRVPYDPYTGHGDTKVCKFTSVRKGQLPYTSYQQYGRPPSDSSCRGLTAPQCFKSQGFAIAKSGRIEKSGTSLAHPQQGTAEAIHQSHILSTLHDHCWNLCWHLKHRLRVTHPHPNKVSPCIKTKKLYLPRFG